MVCRKMSRRHLQCRICPRRVDLRIPCLHSNPPSCNPCSPDIRLIESAFTLTVSIIPKTPKMHKQISVNTIKKKRVLQNKSPVIFLIQCPAVHEHSV